MKWTYERAQEIMPIIMQGQTFNHRDFNGLTLNEDGSLTANFSHYSCGDTDYWEYEIQEEDLHMTNEEVTAKYKKLKEEEEKKKKEEEEKKQKEKEEKEKEEKKRKESIEYETYLELKKKYE